MSKLLDFATPVSRETRKERLREIAFTKMKQDKPKSKPCLNTAKTKKEKHKLFHSGVKKRNSMTIHKEQPRRNQENEETSLLRKKRERSTDKGPSSCMICNWNFPLEMIEKEKQTHVNKCIDGVGQKDKADYLFSQAKAIVDSQLTDSQSEYLYCPICSDPLKGITSNHIQVCAGKIIQSFNKNLLVNSKE